MKCPAGSLVCQTAAIRGHVDQPATCRRLINILSVSFVFVWVDLRFRIGKALDAALRATWCKVHHTALLARPLVDSSLSQSFRSLVPWHAALDG